MANLKTVELKPFVPAKDFDVSRRFYQDFGFTMHWDGNGPAYFHHDPVAFLLQDFYVKEFADNLMLHLLVKNVDDWHETVVAADLTGKYGTKVSSVELRPWGVRDFTVIDPSGVLWRVAQNEQ